jgi:hypothetical protein
MSPRREVTATEIQRYARLCSLDNSIQKRRALMRAEILAKVAEGYALSEEGEYVLALGSQRRLDHDLWSWKIFATELAIEIAGGDVREGTRRVVEAELSAPRKSTPTLTPKINPNRGRDELFRKKKARSAA